MQVRVSRWAEAPFTVPEQRKPHALGFGHSIRHRDLGMEETAPLDKAAAVVSIVCIAHCLSLPILAVTLPFVSSFAEGDWVHWVLATLAVAASLTVILRSESARTAPFLVPAIAGMALVFGGLFVEPYGVDDAIPTVIGGLLLAYAHIKRLARPAKATELA